jgi:hypothetical protein
MLGDRTVGVVLEPTTYLVNVLFAGPGSGTVTGAGGSCTSNCALSGANGSTVTLTAAPAAGAIFMGWSGSCTGTSPTCTLTMTSARTATARFEKAAYRLTIAPLGGGGGTVSGGGLGPCAIAGGVGTGCTADVPYGTTVTLSAAADASSIFQGWSGPCTGTGTCNVTMTTDRTVPINLEPTTYPINVQFSGPGTGSVSALGTTCTSACAITAANDAVVTLTAAPGPSSLFIAWSGSCTGTSPTCNVTMAAARSVTARFERSTYRLSVIPSGGGGGTVSGGGLGPCAITAGVAAATGCAVELPYGSTATLSAAPDGTSLFRGWLSQCTGTEPCTVTMTGDRSLVARLEPTTYPLTIQVTGPGTGTVTGAGVTCTSGSCGTVLANGASVTLTAAVDAGWVFAGWSSSCTGNAPTCTFSMTSARTAIARFENPTYRLTITGGGTGSGTVTADGFGPCTVNGGSVSGACSANLPYGTALTLTATPNSGSQLTGWGGSCSGAGPTCAVTVVGNRTALVVFDPVP